MRTFLVLLLAGVLGIGLIGCDQLKGEKGDKGDSGEQGQRGLQGYPGTDGTDGINGANGENGFSAIVSTKTYTGTPTSSSQYVSIPDFTDVTTQTIECYAVRNEATYKVYYKLPYSHNGYTSHYFDFVIPGGGIFLSSYKSNGQSESTALFDSYWGKQFDYFIVLKTFRTASACIAYKQSQQRKSELCSSYYNQLIYGEEIN